MWYGYRDKIRGVAFLAPVALTANKLQQAFSPSVSPIFDLISQTLPSNPFYFAHPETEKLTFRRANTRSLLREKAFVHDSLLIIIQCFRGTVVLITWLSHDRSLFRASHRKALIWERCAQSVGWQIGNWNPIKEILIKILLFEIGLRLGSRYLLIVSDSQPRHEPRTAHF